jgi:hypothetical protein
MASIPYSASQRCHSSVEIFAPGSDSEVARPAASTRTSVVRESPAIDIVRSAIPHPDLIDVVGRRRS